jgi:hypothetical protein
LPLYGRNYEEVLNERSVATRKQAVTGPNLDAIKVHTVDAEEEN